MSFIDARTQRPGHVIEADLCVIGSGAAGLAVARRFVGTSINVAILESGGNQPDEETQDLYRGESVGQGHSPLHSSRLRYYGGSTNHWSAHVRPLDPIDFEERPWVPHSNWPFELGELEPYYEETRHFLGLPENPFEPMQFAGENRQPWIFEDERLLNRVRRVIPEQHRRLGPIMRYELAASKNVHVYLHANVLRITLAEGRKQVQQLKGATLDGKLFTARARAFVLATGGIENPRILHLSKIGTNPDPRKNLVGRYFANHPEVRLAMIQMDSKFPGHHFYKGVTQDAMWALPLVSPSASTQRQNKLLNTWMDIRTLPAKLSIPGLEDRLRVFTSDMHHIETGNRSSRDEPGDRLMIRAICEQAPNPESRVMLGRKTDRFGQRQVRLDWQLSDLDDKSARATVDLVTREIGIAGLGRVKSLFPKGGFSTLNARGSFHHMGTTRMH
jgi:choline dehydrogenase-like flavoprotein